MIEPDMTVRKRMIPLTQKAHLLGAFAPSRVTPIYKILDQGLSGHIYVMNIGNETVSGYIVCEVPDFLISDAMPDGITLYIHATVFPSEHAACVAKELGFRDTCVARFRENC